MTGALLLQGPIQWTVIFDIREKPLAKGPIPFPRIPERPAPIANINEKQRARL